MAEPRQAGGEREAFRRRIADGLVLGDAAYGTALTGVAQGRLVELLNIENPAAVEALHLSYLRAGAEVLQTNTYAANRAQLRPYGLEGEVYALNLQGARIARAAREIAGEAALIAGSVGPIGVSREGQGAPTADGEEIALEQIEALIAGGVDLLLIETQADPSEAEVLLSAARRACDLPVILNFSFAEGDRTLSGHSVEDIAEMLRRQPEPPDLFGVNCSLGPSHALRLLRLLREAGVGTPFAVAPNAGPPMRVGAEIDYLGTPERFAALLGDLRAEGACLVGGCCGTDAAYIAALRDARALLAGGAAEPQRRAGVLVRARADPSPKAVDQGLAPRAELAGKLGQAFVLGVELDPPRGSAVGKFLEDAARVRESGADFVDVGDSPMARVRMSSVAGAHLVQQEAGIEAVLHMTTRDRTRRGLEADLLGAHALGLRNVLAVTGDRPPDGGVFEIDAIGLLQAMRSLNAGEDLGGAPIGTPTAFLAGCAFDPGALDLEREISRLWRKRDAGARFVMTQPIYEAETLRAAFARLGPLELPVLLGVMPLYSYRHAVFLDREVAGVRIPQGVLERMRRAGERGLREGLRLAGEILEEIPQEVSGVYIVPSFGKVGPIAELLAQLREEHPATRSAAS